MALPKGYKRRAVPGSRQIAVPQRARGKSPLLRREVKDRNFRIEVAADGVHVFNKDGHWVASDALALFDKPRRGTGRRARLYLGAELQKAEIAYRLGKPVTCRTNRLTGASPRTRPLEDRTRLAG